jgi:hypothetical protein
MSGRRAVTQLDPGLFRYQRDRQQFPVDRTVAGQRTLMDPFHQLVVVTAALHGPAQILTSDPKDIRAYTATLDHMVIITETI